MGFFDRIFHRSPKVRTLTAGMTPLKIPAWAATDNAVGAVYAYARPIAERIASVPISCSIDAPQAVRALDGDVMYRVAIGVLTHSVVLLVPRTDGGDRPTTGNVRGWDVVDGTGRDLSRDAVETDFGTFSLDDVCILSYDVLPDGAPVSPLDLAGDWVDIDQMTAAHERAFFANGAVPAAMVNIVSETNEDFEREKTRYEDSVRGAGQSNGTIYTRTPVDPMTGEPVRPKIDVQTIQPPNNELDLATIDDITDRHLAEAYGTPAIVRGVDIGQTYSNAELAEVSFTRYTVAPFAGRLALQMSREIRRVTRDSREWELRFELPDIELTDRAAVRANVNATTVSSLLALKGAGFGTEEAIEALGLSERWRALIDGEGGGSGEGGETGPSEPPDPPEPDDGTGSHIAESAAARALRRSSSGKSRAERELYSLFEKARTGADPTATASAIAALVYGELEASMATEEGTRELREFLTDIFGATLAATCVAVGIAAGKRGIELWASELVKRCDVDPDVQEKRAAAVLDEAVWRFGHERDWSAFEHAASETGTEVSKTWVTARDELVCPECGSLDGTMLKVDEPFAGGLDGPPMHPNCRCMVKYSIMGTGSEWTAGDGWA